MGMFDTIWVKCPQCQADVDFQSKSGQCILGEYELDDCPDDVMLDANRHSPVQCDCGALLEIDRINRSVIINGAAGEKIKVSSHQTDLQGANSGQLHKHNVMESVCPVCDGKGWYFVDEWIGGLQGRKDCRCKGQTAP